MEYGNNDSSLKLAINIEAKFTSEHILHRFPCTFLKMLIGNGRKTHKIRPKKPPVDEWNKQGQ